jgi:hypothetical protein
MKYLRFLVIALALLGLSFAFFDPVTVSASAVDDLCEGIGSDASGDGCVQEDGGPSVEGIIGTVINILSLIVGIVAVIMIIFGGFKYITAGGDSGQLTSARHTITYAIVGLVIVALAQFIVQFVIQQVTGSNEEETTLPIASSLFRIL